MKHPIINQVEEIRRDNNRLWMDILRVAMDKAPEETKKILVKINANDRKVTGLLGMLANE